MDNLTHSLFALTVARTPLRRSGAGVPLALVLASNAPAQERRGRGQFSVLVRLGADGRILEQRFGS
jgi:hypothetical protein